MKNSIIIFSTFIVNIHSLSEHLPSEERKKSTFVCQNLIEGTDFPNGILISNSDENCLSAVCTQLLLSGLNRVAFFGVGGTRNSNLNSDDSHG